MTSPNVDFDVPLEGTIEPARINPAVVVVALGITATVFLLVLQLWQDREREKRRRLMAEDSLRRMHAANMDEHMRNMKADTPPTVENVDEDKDAETV